MTQATTLAPPTAINPDSPTRGLAYFVVPAEVWFAKDLSPQDVMLLVEIDALSRNDHGGCYASNAYLAKMLRTSPQSIQNSISHVRECGYLTSHTLPEVRDSFRYTPPLRILTLTEKYLTLKAGKSDQKEQRTGGEGVTKQFRGGSPNGLGGGNQMVIENCDFNVEFDDDYYLCLSELGIPVPLKNPPPVNSIEENSREGTPKPPKGGSPAPGPENGKGNLSPVENQESKTGRGPGPGRDVPRPEKTGDEPPICLHSASRVTASHTSIHQEFSKKYEITSQHNVRKSAGNVAAFLGEGVDRCVEPYDDGGLQGDSVGRRDSDALRSA